MIIINLLLFLKDIEMDLQVIVIADSKDGASKVEQEKVNYVILGGKKK